MSELNDLYQDIILEHNKHPSHFCKLEDATHQAEGFNPLCGDELTLYLRLDGERIEGVSFEGQGCAISRASASIMTDLFEGKTLSDAKELFGQLKSMLLEGEGEIEASLDTMGDLAALSGVRQFPMRIKCATLAWHTFEAALAGQKRISTEDE